MSNAIKFTPEGGTVNLNTRFVGSENGICTISLTVTDSGIGITPEQRERLFDTFHQAESHTSRRFGGTGLGLVISKNIAEMMGGEILLDSEIGKGSEFTFIFKAEQVNNKDLPRLEVEFADIRIMAVDDDIEILDYFKEILARYNVTCDTASSGAEALALINKNGFYNIYFVDWKMPDMDGLELAKHLKKEKKDPDNTIVIMTSAAEWIEIAEEVNQFGVDSFLSKPLFPSSIIDIITELTQTDKDHGESKSNDFNGIFDGYRILLAEDVEINREIVSFLLLPTMLELDLAENGEEAVKFFMKNPHKYDLILMDLQMPKMDGYTAAQKIREAGYNKPIVAMTANVFKEDIEQCLKSGMDDHIGKPFDVYDVMTKLQKYLYRQTKPY